MAGIPYKHRYSADYWTAYQFNFAGLGQAEPGMTSAERRAGAASATRAGLCPVDAVELPGSYGLQYTESGTAKYPYSIDGGLLYLTPAGFLRKVHELNVERCPPAFWKGATPDSWYPVRKMGGGYTYELVAYEPTAPGFRPGGGGKGGGKGKGSDTPGVGVEVTPSLTVPADGKPGPTDFVGAQRGGGRRRRARPGGAAPVSPLALAGGAAALLLLAGGAYAALGGR